MRRVSYWVARFQLWVGPNSRVEFGIDGAWVNEMKFWNSEVNFWMRGIVVFGCLNLYRAVLRCGRYREMCRDMCRRH